MTAADALRALVDACHDVLDAAGDGTIRGPASLTGDLAAAVAEAETALREPIRCRSCGTIMGDTDCCDTPG